MSVRPSDRMEQIGLHWADFREILLFSVFRKTVEKFQGSLQTDKNKWHFI